MQLVRDHQRLSAIQLYQSKVGGSLGEAKEAVDAIESGLRNSSAPAAVAAVAKPFDVNSVRELLASGNKIAAIKAYRDQTGSGLREAATAVDGMERQLYPDRARPTLTTQASKIGSGARGCAAVVGSILLFTMCIFGGCGAYLQTQAIYGCSMREIRNVLAQERIFKQPVDGGYLVVSPGYESESGFGSWRMSADYFAPVWGANGWGVVYSHVAADSSGWNRVSARLYTPAGNQELFAARRLACGP